MEAIAEEPEMSAVIVQEQVRIPSNVSSLRAFRRWAQSDAFPETGHVAWLDGEVWVDMSPEQLITHNKVKGRIGNVLDALALEEKLGMYFHDRTLLSNPAADLSTEPDGVFASFETLEEGRARLVENQAGPIEMEGSPDMVLEVVSPSSVRKNTVVLPRLYWRAGISEFWLVDARGERPKFDILVRGRSAYLPTPKTSGWLASRVFGHSFRIVAEPNRLGYPEFTLRVR